MRSEKSDVKSGTAIFIREDPTLPVKLGVDCKAFLPGWRIVKNIDSYALARKFEDAKWHMFHLAGDMKTLVLGGDRPGTLRRAVKALLAKQSGQKFNCLMITKTVAKRFLGIPFLRVTAHSQHIQESDHLEPAKKFVLGPHNVAALRKGLESNERLYQGEVAAEVKQAALVSSN